MYGEVYVPYTGIGGMNMDSGIMPADLQGSNMEGGDPSSLHVAWQLPGGITGAPHGYSEAAWGYLFELGVMVSDQEVYNKLCEENLAETMDGSTYTITDEVGTRNLINRALNLYVDRIMDYTLNNPGADENNPLSLNSFLFHFKGCVERV